MFGVCRYILSTLVVFSHLWMKPTPWAGVYSVCLFYMISGYLTMHVRTKTYGFDFQGGLRFAFNRVLRIFPAYYAVLLLAFVMLLFIPESIEKVPPPPSIA